MRSTALALGRKLDAGGDANGARLAHGFATALLDDLKSFPQGVNFAYDTARAYSVAFNNAYTKTFAGICLQQINQVPVKLHRNY